MLSEWKKSFLEIIVDKCAPLRKARVRGRGSPWITSELKKQMHERDILIIKVIKSNDPAAWAKFKKQRNIVNKAVKQAKQFYYQTSFSDHKGDSRKTWQIINELTSRTSGKSSVRELRVDGQSVTNPAELAWKRNLTIIWPPSVQNLAVKFPSRPAPAIIII